MISSKTLDINWIKEVSAKNRKADKILVEKVIRALFLLEGIVKSDLEFIFKGGTALMLMFNSSKRLSIDIDIIVPKEPANIEKLFDNIVKEQGFIKWELQERTTNSNINKAHYKFYYNPIHKTHSDEEYILLDILFEKNNYKKLVKRNISSQFVITEGDLLTVSVPSFDDILGDKLTAFAPNTTGIPYKKGNNRMSMEIIKQLYDIGNLVDAVDNTETIKETFSIFAKTELKYRNKKDLSKDDVLEDIFQTSLCLISRGKAGAGIFEELQKGIQRLTRYVFSEPFYLDKAITLASKAAYISTLIKNNVSEIEKYDKPDQMNDWLIEAPLWKGANKLKKSNPEAFFYWYKIHELL